MVHSGILVCHLMLEFYRLRCSVSFMSYCHADKNVGQIWTQLDRTKLLNLHFLSGRQGRGDVER